MADAQPVPIRSTLFSFVTLRTPQLIEEDKKAWVAITHPDPAASHFRGTRNLAHRRAGAPPTRAETLAKAFAPVWTRDTIRTTYAELARFGAWLSRHRVSLRASDLADRMAGLEPLSRRDQVLVWDQLIYQMIRQEDPLVRQSCITLLLASHVLEHLRKRPFADADLRHPDAALERRLRRLAAAKVVFPRGLPGGSGDEDHDDVSDLDSTTRPTDTTRDAEERQPARFIPLEAEHLQTKQAWLEERYKRMARDLRRGLRAAEIRAGAGSSRDAEEGTALRERLRPHLSAESNRFLDQFGQTLPTMPDMIAVLREQAADVRAAIRGWRNSLPVNADLSPVDAAIEAIPAHTYVGSAFALDGGVCVALTFVLPDPGGFVKACDYELLLDGRRVAASQSVLLVPDTSQHATTIVLQPDEPVRASDAKSFRVQGTVTFNRRDAIPFDLEGTLLRPLAYPPAPPPSTARSLAVQPPTRGGAVATTAGATTTAARQSARGPASDAIYGVNRLGMGVYRRVEQEVCCYVPGEVSRIENILAREYKERHTRTLLTTESTTEDTESLEVEQQSDTATTTRNELQTEIASELSRDNSIGAGATVGVEGKIPGASTTLSAGGYFDYASGSASSLSDAEAETFAREVTEQAAERVVQKASAKRTSRIFSEYEENNRHGFDNRAGDQHVTGVYRWIDIIYTNRLVNYGTRLMIEFVLPEPARFYRAVLKRVGTAGSGSGNGSGGTAPPPPSPTLAEHGIAGPEDITDPGYLELARIFDLRLPEPISPPLDVIEETFRPADDPAGEQPPGAKKNLEYNFTLNFMSHGDYASYRAYKVKVDGSFDYHFKGTEKGTYFDLEYASEKLRFDKDSSGANALQESGGTNEREANTKDFVRWESGLAVKNDLSITVRTTNVYGFRLTFEVHLEVDPSAVTAWQQQVYDLLVRREEELLEERQAKIDADRAAADAAQAAAAQQAESTAQSQSPTANRAIEQREIKRLAIELLLAPFGYVQGKDFYERLACQSGNLRLGLTNLDTLDRYAASVKFFEQAIDWKLMGYLFYPYYWADPCRWEVLMQERAPADPIFEGFLQSGMGRAVIPVRRGFEEAVDHFLETGEIWNGGGMVMDTEDDLYLSIDDELAEESEYTVGEEWQTRLPTQLTIVQGSSVYLEDAGLPCCELHAGEHLVTGLKPSTATLGVVATVEPTS